jgi:uncharacterized membrane protein
MQMLLPVHIAAGSVGIITGFAALYAAKGANAHRRTGTWFVYSMLVMALTGAFIAAVGRGEASVIGGLLAAYLVATGLTTVRPRTAASGRVDRGALLVGLAIGVASTTWGVQAARSPGGAMDGIPAPMFFIFGTVALLAGAGDLRMIRSGGARGPRRIARHLWRMCFALWIASSSFFLGQADEFPASLRIFPLLMIPAFAPLLVMGYWMWRVRIRGRLRGLVVSGSAEGGKDGRLRGTIVAAEAAQGA